MVAQEEEWQDEEREQKAATALVAHTAKVAEELLSQAGVKLSHKKHSYTKSAWRKASYEQGKVDSRDIDINQRSLAGPAAGGGKGKAKA